MAMRVLLFGAVLLLAPGAAWADAVPGPPPDCPPGWAIWADSHGGEGGCRGIECSSDAQCSIGTVCGTKRFEGRRNGDGSVSIDWPCTDPTRSDCIDVAICVEGPPLKNLDSGAGDPPATDDTGDVNPAAAQGSTAAPPVGSPPQADDTVSTGPAPTPSQPPEASGCSCELARAGRGGALQGRAAPIGLGLFCLLWVRRRTRRTRRPLA